MFAFLQKLRRATTPPLLSQAAVRALDAQLDSVRQPSARVEQRKNRTIPPDAALSDRLRKVFGQQCEDGDSSKGGQA